MRNVHSQEGEDVVITLPNTSTATATATVFQLVCIFQETTVKPGSVVLFGIADARLSPARMSLGLSPSQQCYCLSSLRTLKEDSNCHYEHRSK